MLILRGNFCWDFP